MKSKINDQMYWNFVYTKNSNEQMKLKRRPGVNISQQLNGFVISLFFITKNASIA
jgi:hypothetical protein